MNNILELKERMKHLLYASYPMLVAETTHQASVDQRAIKAFFDGLIPVIHELPDGFLDPEGVYDLSRRAQLITIVKGMVLRCHNLEHACRLIDEIFLFITEGDWEAAGGDNQTAGGVPTHELRLALLEMLVQYASQAAVKVASFYQGFRHIPEEGYETGPQVDPSMLGGGFSDGSRTVLIQNGIIVGWGAYVASGVLNTPIEVIFPEPDGEAG